MRRWAEFVGAITLLTRLPVGRLAPRHPPPADTVWAYPLVGLLVGLPMAAILAVCLAIGLPQPLAALLALATGALLTGGLHEDGLADTADGLGGGRSVERKLAIMRDSRIGSYGALALVFSVLLRATALALSPHPVRALVIAAILARGAMLLPVLLLRPARTDGLAAMLATAGHARLAAALALGAMAGAFAPAALTGGVIAGLAVTALVRRHIGGYTGDTLGAAEQVAECAILSALAA